MSYRNLMLLTPSEYEALDLPVRGDSPPSPLTPREYGAPDLPVHGDSPPPPRTPSPTKSDRFRAADADVTFRSSDDILFLIHRKYLENTSGSLLPPDFVPNNIEVIDLDEEASTLELMFQFVYPQCQPPFEGMHFATLEKLAEAVEKYQIYPAMQICNVYMGKTLPNHAVKILDFAIKHDYPAIADQAAPHVTPTKIAQAADAVSHELLRAWAKYYERWTYLRRSAMGDRWQHRHSCNNWVGYQMTILVALGSQEGINNDASVVDVISVEDTQYSYCCRQEAARWREHYLSVLSGIPKFSAYL
ncbi:hypothetical protein FPV67DRAFT_1481337 [Lyophyllum atratum]|nr:hypothetical protein FPV67DRAFT_1481337 [Lyophyllum atratum]